MTHKNVYIFSFPDPDVRKHPEMLLTSGFRLWDAFIGTSLHESNGMLIFAINKILSGLCTERSKNLRQKEQKFAPKRAKVCTKWSKGKGRLVQRS